MGPLSLSEVKHFIGAGKINKETTVWDGEGDWKPASKTALSEYFHISSDIPPPLGSRDIYNVFVWFIVAMPILGAIAELIFIDIVGNFSFLLYLIPNIVLCILDERKLKAAGHGAPSTKWCILIPVYLWKRANILGQKKLYFWAWGAAFLLSFAITATGNDAVLEDSTCPVVTDIVQNQFYEDATCKAVNIDEEVSDGFYKATAILDDGTELFITIEETDDNNIYVRIPSQ